MSGYEYTLCFRKTMAHANADALSRLPLPKEPVKTTSPPELVLLAEHLAESPVTANDIRTWTWRDTELSRVLQYLQQVCIVCVCVFYSFTKREGVWYHIYYYRD